MDAFDVNACNNSKISLLSFLVLVFVVIFIIAFILICFSFVPHRWWVQTKTDKTFLCSCIVNINLN